MKQTAVLFLVVLICVSAMKSPGQEKVSADAVPDSGACVWVFESYESSHWENEWRRGEESGEYRFIVRDECDVLAQANEVKRSVQLITAVTSLMLHGTPVLPESIKLFSRMVYARRCGPELKDTGRRRVQLIEPLVGILRDPLTICKKPLDVPDEVYESFSLGESAIQSKRHLLTGPMAPWTETPDDPNSWRVGGFAPWAGDEAGSGNSRRGQTILMDIGASLYDNWFGDPATVSALWFVDRFKRHNLSFDWIVSFDIEKFDPDELYRNVPPEVLPHYIYFNQGVEATPGAKWNPWRILRGMSITPEDYVAVKLDIDMPEIENALMDQLQKDPKIRLLVDEMFYEHHVNVRAMWRYWGTEITYTMPDTYRLFGDLRSKGVRMHSWP
jgi:hypothetical protein